MSLKSIPITDEETLELFIKAKKKFVNDDPYRKQNDNNILKEALKSYVGEQ